MIFDKDKLKKSLSKFEIKEDRFVLSGDFLKLLSPRNTISNKFHEQISFISADLWNLVTLSLRLDWQRKLYIKKQIHAFVFFQFVECDVNQFHVNLRSIFDYTANIIKIISKPDQVPDSFEKIKNRIDKLEEAGVIEGPLASIIREQEWFDNIREVRNLDVHKGGKPLVSVDEDSSRLIFQMFTPRYRKKVDILEIRYNEDTVFLDSYIGICFGYLIDYLEKLAEFILKKYDLKTNGNVFLDVHGLEVLHQWICNCTRVNV